MASEFPSPRPASAGAGRAGIAAAGAAIGARRSRSSPDSPALRAALAPRAALALGAALLVAAGCGSGAEPGQRVLIGPPRTLEGQTRAPRRNASSAERFGLGAPAPAAARPATLVWDTPAGWTELPPSSMRAASFRVGGDERAECYLALLSGEAGGLAANVDRWRAQMSLPAMASGEAEALPRAELLGRPAALLDLRGRWTGMSGEADGEDHRLLGLLAVGADGSAFLKMVGPAATIEREREDFLALARSFRRSSEAPRPAPASGDDDPMRPMREGSAGAAGITSGSAEGLTFAAPAGWQRAPDRATRALSFDVAPGTECYVTILSGDAGGALANVNRWRKQLGREELSAAELESLPRFPMLGSEALLVEIEGRTAGTGGGAPADSMLLGAVCIRPGRSVFVKLTGPPVAVEPERSAFQAFCASLGLER